MSGGSDGGWRAPTVLACGHEVLDPDQVHYCAYISLSALEALTKPFAADPASARDPITFDETLFVVAHQVTELMLGNTVASLHEAIRLLSYPTYTPAFRRAHVLVRRAVAWIKTASAAFAPLRTMEEFPLFRARLAPASGAESVNTRRIEILAGLREGSLYVVERDQSYTYRGFLDRPPGPGPDDPKTRWWTEELTSLARQPSLWTRLQDRLADHGLGLEDVYYRPHEHRQAPDAPPPPELDACLRLRPLCETLVGLEDAYRDWRHMHTGTAAREIGKLPGTGHTSGVPYLNAVDRTACFFPCLQDLSKRYASPQPGGEPPGW